MDELSPGARSLLQAADTYDDPSPEDAARVRRAVLTRVGAIGLTAATAAVISDASLNRLRFIVRLLSDDGLYPNLEEFSGLRSPVAPGALEGGKPRSCRPH